MELCSFIFSIAIVGAVESRPGIMHVEYLDQTILKMSKKSTSTQKTTSSAGTTEFPFDNLDLLIQEEQDLPEIPDWPTIWSTANTSNERLPKK